MSNTILEQTKPSEPISNLELILIGIGCSLCIIACGLIYYQLSESPRTTHSVPPLAPTDSPVQHTLFGEEAALIYSEKANMDWTLTPRASFQISARVLGNKRYSDWQSPLIPRDLALAWGAMSDPAVDQWISWRQSGRWYHYNWGGDSPYKNGAVGNNSANIHIIPATENLARILKDVNSGDIIYMEGLLVDVDVVVNGRVASANTSLTRTDVGGSACEIFYVEQLILNEQLHQ